MTRRVTKGFTTLLMAVSFLVVVAATSANAQSRDLVSADIPFEFIVGNHVLPAGTYSVRPVSDNSTGLMIRNRETSAAAIRLSNDIQGKEDESTPRLVFHRYGNSYFLSEVWSGGKTGREIFKSSQERAMNAELAKANGSKDSAKPYYEKVAVVAMAR